VTRSEEEEAKKQKERDKKVAAYQHAMNAIFAKVSSCLFVTFYIL